MRRLAGDPAHRQRLAAAGFAAFQERWSESAVVPQYLEIVTRAARQKGDHRVLSKLDPKAGGRQPSVDRLQEGRR
jgi:hypothetical protein